MYCNLQSNGSLKLQGAHNFILHYEILNNKTLGSSKSLVKKEYEL